MAGKTYLQLVNLVLVNLRESQVSTVSQTAYSALVGQFINQAKEQVEDSYPWRAQITELSWLTTATPTSGSTSVFQLDAVGTDPVINSSTGRFANERTSLVLDDNGHEMMFDITDVGTGSLTQLIRLSRPEQLKGQYRNSAQPVTLPIYYSFGFENQVSYFRLWTPPTTSPVRNLKGAFIIPQVELSNDADAILVPFRPVVTLATALAFEERGEELGQDSDCTSSDTMQN